MKNTFIFCFAVLLILVACSGRSPHPNGTGTDAPSDAPATQQPQTPVRPTVNVYIENSGSMDGYVKGVTGFEQAVYSYLSDIKISRITDTLNLFYINSTIISRGSDIADFIEKLEPSDFKQKGGNLGVSDIANILNSVLDKTSQNKISILVTDGIFSPGKKGKEASEYLINQQISIKRRMAEYLRRYPNTAVIVYQLYSNFNGTYYNNIDNGIKINEQRPFYIWVIGDAKQVSKLREKVPDSRFKGSGVQHVFTSISGNHLVAYALNPSVGSYKKSKTQHTIENLEKDRHTKQVKFAVDVNFSNLLLDSSYLTNLDNYENNSRYTLKIEPNAKSGRGYTHTLRFTASDNRVHKGEVSVKLKAKLPDWVEDVNDDNGSTAVSGKTYGIKYQLGGIYEAFTFENNYYTEIKININ
ncbi:MAG: hypothetical protein LBG80_05630 [Bacteroidales bacterium]|jgi:hypothetical protein|nr:hypothetical protein [Bacteroidales bacterium]